jgi:sugar lactone lactonase YvrE
MWPCYAPITRKIWRKSWHGAVFFMLALPGVSAAQCVPANSQPGDTEIARLRDSLQKQPGNPVLLYNLAADYATKCDQATTLDLLRRVSEAGGGLDPSDYRGFMFLHDIPEFRAIVAGVRRKNPPHIQSKTAFVIKEPDLFPEGMAYAGYNGRVYAGSLKRKIVWTDNTGQVHDFVKEGENGLAFVGGLHVDASRRQLWAVSSTFAPLPAGTVQGLFHYDLDTGKLLEVFPLPDAIGGFLNDVVVDPKSGTAYTTNTAKGNVYVARPGTKDLSEFLPPDSVSGANGIALSSDGRALFVAGDFGIARVDLHTRSVRMLGKPPDAIDASMDGLYFYRQSLVGIQNAIHPGRVMRFYLDSDFTRIVRSEILETYNPLFDTPTTGAIAGDSLLFMANTQLHKASPGKQSPPASELHNILIQQLALKPD